MTDVNYNKNSLLFDFEYNIFLHKKDICLMYMSNDQKNILLATVFLLGVYIAYLWFQYGSTNTEGFTNESGVGSDIDEYLTSLKKEISQLQDKLLIDNYKNKYNKQ